MGLEISILDNEPRIPLVNNDCWHADLFPRQLIVWATRTSVPFASREHIDALYLPVHQTSTRCCSTRGSPRPATTRSTSPRSPTTARAWPPASVAPP